MSEFRKIAASAGLILLATSAAALGDERALPSGPARVATLSKAVGIDQHLDEQLPLDLPLVDEQGRAVRLGDYFGSKPVVLVLAYYRCPMLCNEVLNGLLRSSQAVKFTLHEDYQIVTVSIDPKETPDLAADKKRHYVSRYRREGAQQGWHFLTAPQSSITRLARTVGFRYEYDPQTDQFAHASGLIVCTPEGKLSRYFYGIDYPPTDLRLALVESSAGRIGSAVDQVLLLCYHYDPRTGQYGLIIANVIRAAGVVTVLGLSTFLWRMFRRERQLTLAVRQQELARASRANPLSNEC